MSGHLFIITAPSGAGKTTLVRLLLENDPAIRLSISYTTRAPRAGETDGQAYHFVDVPSFKGMIERQELLEWAEVYGNYYGTSRVWIEGEMAKGKDVLLEIDWQGAAQVRQLFPEAISIFVLPPSIAELERRLSGRGTDAPEVIERRLAVARDEMRHVGECDYVIINNELQTALDDLLAVVRSCRLRLAAQRENHGELFAALL